MSERDYDSLLRRYEREKSARLQAEAILAQKSIELFERNQELSSLTQALERQVQERTRALAETRDEALQAARAKSDFIANMSHEIRTPLNGVLGILGMLGGTLLSEAQQRLVATASESGHHLLGVINDILDFSKIESGKMRLEESPLNLPDLIHHSMAALQIVARNKGLELQMEVDADFPSLISGDALRLRQILLNLISNAVKFTPRGWVRVRLGRDQHYFSLEVEDSGIGMSPEQCRSIFNAFDQGDSSITRRFGGTGLGLTITRRLACLMKGELSVSSVPEQGSCFRVLLPLHIISPSPIADNIKPQVEASHFDGQSVLLVEDNEVNQLIARHLLEKLNLTVTCCRNGAEAVAAVQNAGFACILMDLQMPVMDGLEATRQIRALPRPLAQIPIIAMTAHASEEHRLQSMENGMDEHLTKPIVVRQLQLTLARFLGVNNKPSDGEDNHQNTQPGSVSPVMDMHRALARLGGNRLLFAELLGTFVREHEGDCHRIVAALVAGDHHSAMVRLHSLAGSAGNIGAAALANTAVVLQHRLAGGLLSDPEELRSELDQSWQMLMLQIQAPDGTLSVPLADGASLGDPDEAPDSPFLDPRELLLGCEKIMNWLHQDLVQVDETLSSLLLCPVPSLYLERLSQLQQLLNQFCIEDAEALLQQLIDDLREAIAYE